VSSFTPELIRNCKRCSHELAPGALVCDQCQALVYADKLDQLASEAKAMEAKGELLRARDHWLMGLPLLPRGSSQAAWIQNHALELNAAAQNSTPSNKSKWVKRLAPLGPLAAVLAKGKLLLTILFKMKFLLSLAAFLAIYWAQFGPKFAIGFTTMILIHEMGHFIDVKRRGLPAEMPVFLPGLGAYVRWQALGVSLETRAAVSLAGPFAGWLAAAACALFWFTTHHGIWAALAWTGAWLNVLNLIPVPILDGGHAVLALNKAERLVLLVACLALWLGFGQWWFILVAAGAGWRLFTKDAPPEPSPKITAYFVTVLTLLALILWMVPGQSPVPR
jgi:Zn-dependent protease